MAVHSVVEYMTKPGVICVNCGKSGPKNVLLSEECKGRGLVLPEEN